MTFRTTALLSFSIMIWASAPKLACAEELAEEVFREELVLSELQRDDGYAQAVRVGGVVFISATTAPGGDFQSQMKNVYARLQAALGQYGLSMANVAQERIYTKDMAALRAAVPVRRVFYGDGPVPAVSWVEVEELFDEDRLLAIELFAVAEE